MNISENIKLGVESLMGLKVRSFLTMLGIIFGVAAVIAMTSISSGARQEMMETIEVLGVNNIIVKVFEPDDEDIAKENRKKNPKGLNLGDVAALKELIEDSERIVPLRRVEKNIYMPTLEKSSLMGTWPEFLEVFHLDITAGRFLKKSDSQSRAMVAVITEPLRRKLFPLTNPLGQKIKVDKLWFTIVGVVDPVGGGFSAIGLDLDDMSRDIYVPLETLNAKLPVENDENQLASLLVEATNANKVQSVAVLIKRILDRRHNGVKDVEIVVPVELLKQSQQAQQIFNVVMGAIASISLLVGGIGIMNIMLSSVLERTREIGVRRAVGAKRGDIVTQFLLEAVMLCIIGGVLGIIIGVVMAWGINVYAGWRTAVGLWAVLLAFGVSASVGIIFGWWPAKKAAEMDVINALRYE
jgi:putative ABC transport system permease protein